MTAPVSGSGCWPPWMTRVAKGWLLFSSVIWRTRCCDEFALHLATQPIEQVDARDQALKLAPLHDDRHHAALEDLHELRYRRVHRYRHQVARHRLGDRLVEVLGIVHHLEQDVLLVHDADDATVVHH